jgi:hypothetical protein
LCDGASGGQNGKDTQLAGFAVSRMVQCMGTGSELLEELFFAGERLSVGKEVFREGFTAVSSAAAFPEFLMAGMGGMMVGSILSVSFIRSGLIRFGSF